MKVGITVKDYYKDYLTKIANLNYISLTKVCSLILENFLSYNLKKKQFPKFRKYVRIEFDENCESDSNNSFGSCGSRTVGSNSEQPTYTHDQLIEQLEMVPENPSDEDFLPFESED